MAIGLGVNFRPPPRSYVAEASAYFSAMSVQPDEARKDMLAALVTGLKGDGVWANLDAFYLMASHDAQAARLNLINPAEVLNAYNSPTFTTDRGYSSDGIASYLDEPVAFSARSHYTQDSASMFVWVNAGATSDNGIVGSIGSSPGVFIAPARASTTVMRSRLNDSISANSGTGIVSPLGFSAISRLASGTYSQYRDGVELAALTVATSGLPAGGMNIGHPGGTYNTQRAAVAGLGGGLSAPQVASLHARLNTYLTAIGAN